MHAVAHKIQVVVVVIVVVAVIIVVVLLEYRVAKKCSSLMS